MRARKFDVDAAVAQYVDYRDWYVKNDIANISKRPPPRADIISKLVPSAYYGFDRTGHPVHYERTGSIDCELFMNQFTDNEIYVAHVWGQEKQITRCLESCERLGLPPGSIDSWTTVIDAAGLSLRHRAMLKFSKLVTEADQKYYPERMHKTIIVNPSGLFSFFWKLVRGWLDPVTREKIIVCTDGNPELFEIIDPSQVPKRYGGTADVPGLEDPPLDELYETLCKDTRPAEDWKHEKIAAGTTFIRTVRMNLHDTYNWIFRADDSIGFESYFRPDPVDGKQEHDRCVTAFNTAPANKIPNQGIFYADTHPGELFLVWKNENWFSSINLSYIIESIDVPESAETHESKEVTPEAPAATTSASPADATSPTSPAVPEAAAGETPAAEATASASSE